MISFSISLVLLTLLLTVFPESSSAAGEKHSKHIFIAGSGINGAATAFFLRELWSNNGRLSESDFSLPESLKAKKNIEALFGRKVMKEMKGWQPQELQISMVESTSRVGGRVFPVSLSESDDGQGEVSVIEVGASVYHAVNFYMASIVKRFNLTNSHPYLSTKVGVWNGKEFAFQEHPSSTWISMFRALWRYGFDPLRMQNCVEKIVNHLLSIYWHQVGEQRVFDTSEEMLEALSLLHFTTFNISSYLMDSTEGCGLSKTLASELSHGMARLNYGQGLELSALAGAVAMKGRGDEVFSVKGGNVQLIERLIKEAQVNLKKHVKLSVKGFQKPDCGCHHFQLQLQNEKGELIQQDFSKYDAIVIAFPFPPSSSERKTATDKGEEESWNYPSLKMHTTHVVFVRGIINSSAFGGSNADAKNMQSHFPTIVVTAEDVRHHQRSFKHRVFYRSIGKVRGLNYTYKIFSDEKIRFEELQTIFLANGRDDNVAIPLKILFQHVWQGAYPKLTPKESTLKEEKHSFLLQEGCCCEDQQQKNTKICIPPIYYSGALEKYVSTLETQSIGSLNTALLLMEKLMDYPAEIEDDEKSLPIQSEGREEL